MDSTASTEPLPRVVERQAGRRPRLARLVAWTALACMVLSTGCFAKVDPASESETHFLTCDRDVDCDTEGDGHVCFEALCKTRQDIEAKPPGVEALCAEACRRVAVCLGETVEECTTHCGDSVSSAQGACAEATDEALLCASTTREDRVECAESSAIDSCASEQAAMEAACAAAGSSGPGASFSGSGGTGGAQGSAISCVASGGGAAAGGGCMVQLDGCSDGHRYDMVCEPPDGGETRCQCGRDGVFSVSTTVTSSECSEQFAWDTCEFGSGFPQMAPSVFDDCPASGSDSVSDCDLMLLCDSHDYTLSCTPAPTGDNYSCVCQRDGLRTATFTALLPICSLDLMHVSCPP